MLKITFDSLARRLGMQFSDRETWNDNIIGIDSVNKKFLYVGPLNSGGKSIDLKKVTSHKIIKVAEDNKPVVRPETAARMGILFTLQGADTKDFYLPFYDTSTDDPLQATYHSNRLLKWHQLIEKCCKGRVETVNA